ncbi:T9SS C-terminal target domain-containing protein [candidate division KSB1 bacterium]|nr:MAG: T9SS C-terminal target domain-containing protein [candidate division KSB1 bacterium]
MSLRYLVLLLITLPAFAAPRVSSLWDTVLPCPQSRPLHRPIRRVLDEDSLHRFDVLKIEPHLQFNFTQHTLQGYTEIILRADEISLTQIDFRFTHSLVIDSVWSNDNVSATYTANGLDSLQILLTPALAVGDTMRVGIAYHGNPAEVDNWGGFRWGSADSWRPQIAFSMGDGLNLEPPPANYNWIPSHADPTDKVLWEAWFRVPQSYAVSSGGLRLDTIPHGDNTVTWHYRLDQPVSTYLLFVAVSEYMIMTQRESGPLIENFVYPSRQTQAVTHFSNVPAVLDGYANLFGPYPFDRFGYAMVHMSGDMEHATCVSHKDDAVQANNSWDWLLFHELSHEWWGDWVTCGDWRDLWLNEGFATYCEALGKEILYGYDDYMNYVVTDLFPAGRGANDSYSIYDPDNYWGATVYEKGACVMHMLRQILGDTAFFQAWREYGQEHAFGHAVTPQWQAKLEQHYGSSLDWFFQPWVYGTRYPQYRMTYTLDSTASFMIEQTQPTATLFRMPIDIRVVYPDDTVEFTVWNEAVRSQSFRDTLNRGVPLSVTLDPYFKILKSAAYFLDSDFRIENVPQHFILTGIYPNPFNSAAIVAFDLPRMSAVRLRVFDLLGREVASRNLGAFSAGKHTAVWDGGQASSGVYLFRVETENESRIAKAILMK